MSDGLKWARRLRLDLAFEIQKLDSGVRTVTDMTANGPVDVTSQVLAAQQERFEQLEEMIAGFDRDARAD